MLTNITSSRKLDSLLSYADDQAVAELGQVPDDALELSAGHLDDGGVVCLRDTKMLSIKVHQFHFIIRHLNK